MHHKTRDEANTKSGGEQKALVLSLHHALALPVSASLNNSPIGGSMISADPNSTSSISSSIENLDEISQGTGASDARTSVNGSEKSGGMLKCVVQIISRLTSLVLEIYAVNCGCKRFDIPVI